MSSVIDNYDKYKQWIVVTGVLYRKNFVKTYEVKDFVFRFDEAFQTSE